METSVSSEAWTCGEWGFWVEPATVVHQSTASDLHPLPITRSPIADPISRPSPIEHHTRPLCTGASWDGCSNCFGDGCPRSKATQSHTGMDLPFISGHCC